MSARNRTVAACWIALSLAPAAAAAASDDQEASTPYLRIRHGVAHIGQAGLSGELAAVRWLGTGFLADEHCTVITAKHLLDEIPRGAVVVRFVAREADTVRTWPARVVHEEPDRDLVFLRFGPERGSKRLCGVDLSPLPLSAPGDRVRLTGEPVLVAGYPVLEGAAPRDVPIVRRGIVASAEMDWEGHPMLLLDLTGIPGFSGSPVVLERTGEVIGVIYGPGRTRRMYDLEWATPVTAADRPAETDQQKD